MEISLPKLKTRHFLFVHGAWSTKLSFEYIILRLGISHDMPLGGWSYSFIEYDCMTEKLSEIVERAKKQIKDQKDVTVVGHSMGGLIALSLEKEPNVTSIVTLASPVSGIKFNTFFRMYLMSKNSILQDVSPDSTFIRNLHKEKYTKPVDMLITCEGSNYYITEPNDGVISVSSQVNWKPETAVVKSIRCNHYEILMHSECLDTIKRSLLT